MTQVLLVEDDPQLSRDVAFYLIQAGYQVEAIDRGDWAMSHPDVHNGRFDLAVLDLGLPGAPGLQVLQHWRAHGILLPVLILTARNSWQERVDGLNAGADDYLGKPFRKEELLARLEAMRRRLQQDGQLRLTVYGLTLDEERQKVMLNEQRQEQELTATEFSMLRLLMQKAGKPVSKQQLLDSHYGWQEEKDDNLVEVYIRRLRRKIGEQRIRTLRGQGYVLQQGDN